MIGNSKMSTITSSRKFKKKKNIGKATGLSFSIQPPPLCKNYDTVRISTTPLKCQLDMDLCETNAE